MIPITNKEELLKRMDWIEKNTKNEDLKKSIREKRKKLLETEEIQK